ncbi:fatty acid desaturase [Chryseobacterium arthrosphaerae]|nr:fatty acid desaturase [Chryseobacterium arthrosphaerae]
MKSKIKFKKAVSPFYSELREEVNILLTDDVIRKAGRLLILKFVSYSLAFLVLYANIFFNPYMENKGWAVILNYILLGLTGILLAFNCSHDCVHNTFSKYKKINRIIYYITFNLQGVNARLWKKRHIASHHVFPNVDGCDADIDDNIFIRLSASQVKRKMHSYQHLYATVLYCFYTLHWILIKDFIYVRKKRTGESQKSKPFLDVCCRGCHFEISVFHIHVDPACNFYRYSGTDDSNGLPGDASHYFPVFCTDTDHLSFKPGD